MIVYYAMIDQLFNNLVLHMDDVKAEECSKQLVLVIEGYHCAKSIHALLRKAKNTLIMTRLLMSYK
jgi:hypothetical protein